MTANNLFTARACLLQQKDIAVVLCEKDLTPGTWIDILKHLQPLPHAPTLVVTSRLADDRLWSEVLNFGGWDLLAKPFDRAEVLRSVRSGWQHWYHQAKRPTEMKAMRAS